MAHRIMGMSLVCTGDFVEGRSYLDRAIALYDPAEHRPLATHFGQDVRVAILSYRSLALWMLGYPEAALADAEHAIKDAREIGQAVTLLYALGMHPWSQILCGNYAAANTRLEELVALADEKGSPFWKAAGMFLQGLRFGADRQSLGRRSHDHLRDHRECSNRTNTSLHLRLCQIWRRAHAELGQFDEAWRCISEATAAIETTKERWFEAEVNRIAGEIALKSPEPDAGKAEPYFERALAVARTASKVLGTPRRNEHGPPLARSGQAG